MIPSGDSGQRVRPIGSASHTRNPCGVAVGIKLLRSFCGLAAGVMLAACSLFETPPKTPQEYAERKNIESTVVYSEFARRKQAQAQSAERLAEESEAAAPSEGHAEIIEPSPEDDATASLGEGDAKPDEKGEDGNNSAAGELQVLSLASALEDIWQNHPNVVRAQSEVEASGYDVYSAQTGFLPYLTVSAVEATDEDSNTVVSVVQPLWAGGRTMAEVDEAEASQLKTLAELNQTRLDLALEASDVYLTVIQAKEQVRLWRRYSESLENLLAVIERRAGAGVSPDVDIQTVKTRLSQANAGEAASEAVLISNKLRLEALLHRPVQALAWPDRSYRLTEEEIAAILDAPAIESHPSGQIALADIAIQHAKVRKSKASMYPTLSLQHSRDVTQSSGDFTPDSSTQLVLRYQTNDGLRGLHGFRAVEQRMHASMQELAFIRRDLSAAIQTANAERIAALTQYNAQAAAAEASQMLVESFLRQFKVGRKSWLEVLNAHREAHEASLQAAGIKRNYWAANVRLALQGMMWHRVSVTPPLTSLELKTDW